MTMVRTWNCGGVRGPFLGVLRLEGVNFPYLGENSAGEFHLYSSCVRFVFLHFELKKEVSPLHLHVYEAVDRLMKSPAGLTEWIQYLCQSCDSN
jgi:hypothetical protein